MIIERVRIYDSNINYDIILSKFKAFQWNGMGILQKYSYILCEEDYAFITEGKRVVSHGGLSIEEVIVPFIHIRKDDRSA
ncbi:MAG: hypothetical protein HPY74_15540 [Firmicutes bacterium]|nr:hypothetical protein [Bacillota bacterium]